MTARKLIGGFITMFFVFFGTQAISKALFSEYTNEQIGVSLRTHVPYTGALIGSLIFTVGMYFVAKRGEKKEV